ncbi:MAG: FtsX-like permease family protein [Microthrixaceae bacterium]
MSAWSPLLRRSGRLARRSPVRTASTGALVLVAVAVGTTFLSVVWGDHLRDRSSDRSFGAADAQYWIDATTPSSEDRMLDGVLAAQPEGARTAVVVQPMNVEVSAGEVEGVMSTRTAPWDSPVLAGLLHLADGRAPGAGEAVVSAYLAERSGVDIGSHVEVPALERRFEVVGIGAVGQWQDDAVVFGDGELDGLARPTGAGRYDPAVQVFVSLPRGTTAPSVDLVDLVARPLAPVLRQGAGTGDDAWIAKEAGVTPMRTIGGILALVGLCVGLTAGAAFGIGAARRRRATGILEANGARRHHVHLAIASEAMVVAGPAAVLGLLIGAAVAPVWIALRGPMWAWLVDARVPWAWGVGLVVVATCAAMVGALVLSRSLTSSSTSALLDERFARRAPRRARWGAGSSLVVGLVGFSVLAPLGRLIAGAGLVVIAAATALWMAVAFAALVLGRALLRRDVIGRLVERDLRRRPLGSIAAMTVVAAWVFVAVVGTATDGFRFPASDPVRLATPSVDAAGVLVRPVAGESALPDDLVDELAEAGLATTPAVVQQWTGECAACPGGWVPTVAVLDSVEGTGLSATAVAQLRSGAAVTGWGVADAGAGAVAGVPVERGDVPTGVDSYVLRSTIGEGAGLVDPREAILADTSMLRGAQLDRVDRILRSPAITVTSWDARLDPWTTPSGPVISDRVEPWLLAGLLVLLVLVTMAATVAHRREHGEAAWVLRVLGAGPRAGRRLASITAGTLAALGVALGLTAVVMTLGGNAARRPGDDPFLGLWNRSATLALLAALAVPLVVAALARLLPTDRSAADPRQVGPA